MYRFVSKLLVYSNYEQDELLLTLSQCLRDYAQGADVETTVSRIYGQIKRLLDLATLYGFRDNLWQSYLTFLLMTNENSFTLTTERTTVDKQSSIVKLVKQDLAVFMELFHFDFSDLEKDLQIDCFSTVTQYRAVEKSKKNYFHRISKTIAVLRQQLADANTVDAFYDALVHVYETAGVGMFALNRAFRIKEQNDTVAFLPINNTDSVLLSDLVGYQLQKEQLVANTTAFLHGCPANNVLLYGDAGTGKSTSVKALINEYYDQGLRMIEIYKHQFRNLSEIISIIKHRNYKFIIFIDDLSFEENEIEYKFLKAIIEGGVESRPDNVLIYATSNRRHLIKENWNDRNDMEFHGDVHHSDTMEEKLSLSARFGVSINFNAPDRQLYHEIVLSLAKTQLPFAVETEQLLKLADRWEIRHGGVSCRTAQQFINSLLGKDALEC